MNAHPLDRRCGGFTLIEVLVALALMALLSLISWRALDSVARTEEQLRQSGDDALAIVRVLAQLEQDVRWHAGVDVLPDAALPGRQAGLPPGIRAGGPSQAAGALTVVRGSALHDGLWQQVQWRVENGGLLRAAGAASDTLPLPGPADPTLVLSGVRRLAVRAWIDGRGWSELPLAAGSQAATGLELAIERGPAGAPAQVYRVAVELP